MFRPGTILGCWVVMVAAVGLVATGDVQGKLMFHQQPMKMAAAESLCHTEFEPNFSILSVGTHNNCDSITHVIEVPYVLPFLAKGQFTDVTLQGPGPSVAVREAVRSRLVHPESLRDLLGVSGDDRTDGDPDAVRRLGPVADTTWTNHREPVVRAGGRVDHSHPFLAAIAGWVFTGNGPPAWAVHPNPDGDPLIRLTVGQGVSAHGPALVWVSLVSFTLVYAVLAVIWFYLVRRYVTAGPHEHDAEPTASGPREATTSRAPLSFAY